MIIHIGLHKTGSTSLQRAFRSEHALLRADGIVYPLLAGRARLAQHGLAGAVRHADSAAISSMLREAEQLADGASTILLSSENLSGAPPEGIALLKRRIDEQLGRPETKIYAGIRRWSDRLISFWHMSVRAGGRTAMPAFVKKQLARKADGHRLDIANPIARWTSVFGEGAVIVSPIERATEAGQDLVVHTFRDLLGIDAPAIAGRYDSNRSIIEHTELVRAVNLWQPADDRVVRKAVGRCVARYCAAGKPNALRAAALITPKLESMPLDDDQPLFRELELRSGQSFPARAPRAWRYAPDAVFEDRELAHLVGALHRKAMHRIARLQPQ